MKSGEINIINSVYKTSVNHYEHINSISNETTTNNELSVDNSCDKINGNLECTSRMNGILKEFTKLYAEKIHRLGDVSGEEGLKKKISVLECWINDLGEQNLILVSTVEDLEKEASRRVSLLQEKLDKMAIVTRESCVSLRDHQVQVTSLIKQKLSAEDEAKSLQEKNISLGEANNALLQENTNLRQDLDNVLELMCRGRRTGRWDLNDFSFNLIRPDQFNFELPASQGKICSEYLDNFEHEKCRKDSLTSNLSTDGEDSVPKLRQEIHDLKKIQRDTNQILTQRDKHIADLQAELTELHHRFSAAQAQVDNTTSTLHSLMDRGRQDSFEIFRRDDVIRQLLSPSRRSKNDVNCSGDEEETRGKLDAEYQLSNNIDILANRLIDLEEECQHLRQQNMALKNSHVHHLKLNDCLSDSSNNVAVIPERRSNNVSNMSVNIITKQTQTEEISLSTSDLRDRNVKKVSAFDELRLSKLENEVSEKNILIRELQNHLVLSREELRLKDETLYNVEQKLDCCRRNYDEKEERMLYLTSQLTNLQLEVSRLHGNLQQLRLQLENKSQLVLKLEYENRSLVRQLNEKSSVYEGIQRDFSHLISDIEKKKKEIAEQKLTIGTLQDALVAAKINCDRLKTQFASEVKTSDCNHQHQSRLGHNPRVHKGKFCSCKRAKSAHDQDERDKVFELQYVIDELGKYLKEAHQMALTVERERKILENDLTSCGNFYHQESQRQKDALFRIRNDSLALMSRLRNIKDDLKEHRSSEDLPTSVENPKTFQSSNRIIENHKKWEPSIPLSSPKSKCLLQSEIEYLRNKLIVMNNELRKEKSEKETLSRDANVVVASVRQWLHFQKVANSHLEEKFQEQQIEINHLSQENQFLVEKFRNSEKVHEKLTKIEIPPSASGAAENLFDKQDSLTNDTGIEEASILSSLNSNSLPLGENFRNSQDLNFSNLAKFKPVIV